MNAIDTLPRFSGVAAAAWRREWLSHRLNRFLYAHVALVLLAGSLPLLTPGEGLARGAAWWLLHAVLYAVSLSALLVGLSSAQAEAEEAVWLAGQPAGIGPWLAGKGLALALLAGGSTALLGLPVLAAGGGSRELLVALAGASGVSVVCALAGFALGFWVRDSVRGLIAALALWFVLLFGLDLLLLALAGAPVVQQHPDAWMLPLMLNPLDAYRITVLFAVERAAFSSLDSSALAQAWIRHSGAWLAVNFIFWSAVTATLSWLGARRRLDS